MVSFDLRSTKPSMPQYCWCVVIYMVMNPGWSVAAASPEQITSFQDQELKFEEITYYYKAIVMPLIMDVWKPLAEELQWVIQKVGSAETTAIARSCLQEAVQLWRGRQAPSWHRTSSKDPDPDPSVFTKAEALYMNKAKKLLAKAIDELQYMKANPSVYGSIDDVPKLLPFSSGANANATPDRTEIVAVIRARSILFTALEKSLMAFRKAEKDLDRSDSWANAYKKLLELQEALAPTMPDILYTGRTSPASEDYVKAHLEILRTYANRTVQTSKRFANAFEALHDEPLFNYVSENL